MRYLHDSFALDDSFAEDPLIKDGYCFRYLNTRTGTGEPGDFGTFEISAVPVEFGKTGSRSFLATGTTIYATTQNRPATDEDTEAEN
ncbi:MAG TPA: hypothetical protein VE133_05045 [Candidatus Sulfotelmatobacter sp.]|nr:hypothetical protein [Candidatus Sulfotelmatobacter sp.]